MIPCNPMVGAASRRNASFVGALSGGSTTATTILFPIGTKVGDIALVVGSWQAINITGGDGGWSSHTITWNSYSYTSKLFWKALTAGDLAGVTLNASSEAQPYAVSVYRGATTVTVKDINDGSPGSTLPFDPITKSPSCKGLVSIVVDRDPASSPVPPTPFTLRTRNDKLYFMTALADLLAVGSYVNGTTLSWTDFYRQTVQVGWLVELT